MSHPTTSSEPSAGAGQEPIAIVGRGCVVPDALDPDTFWENIAAGRCSLSPTEASGQVRRFDAAFDATGFAVAADEIMRLDPLFRWVLHAARQALREAGQASGPISGCGLVLGNLSYPSTGLTRFAEQVWRDGQPSPYTDARDRFSSGLPAHFAADALGLGAGAYALDAACASALYAVKLGCDRLHDGTADLMLAGAVSCPDRLLIRDGFQALQAASPSGRSRPFHRAADGLVAGEGAAMVALMRLGDALRSGTPILGVIRAVGLSNDGRTGGLLSPAESGQVRAMRLAYAQAGVAPESVSLVECHATGTPVGDAVEARSMARVFAGSTDLPIGSVKSNVGHLLAAAGAAGLLKVLGAIRAGIRPPSLSTDDPIEALDGTPLRLLSAAEQWPGPRRAAVSAFGFGGTNAHLIIDEWLPEAASVSNATTRRPGGSVAITALAAKVADGADADAFRRALLLGESRPVPRTSIDVAVSGLRFPPNDLRSAHAQHTLLLETAREATATIQLPGERTMVVVGMGVDPEVARYPVARRAGAGTDTPLTGADVLGTMPNLIANRVNVQLNLSGPSYTVSAEQASGLVALELASRALRAGEVDAAVVGAVDLSCEPVHQAAARALGKDRPPGDAAVVLVLERLSDAHRNGRQVIAVLDEQANDSCIAELVVGDAEPDDGVAHFDPAELFGVPHAAAGLLATAVAATAIRHRAIPRAGHPAVPVRGDMVARVVVAPLGASPASVTLRSAGAAQPWTAGPAPRLLVYSGPDRAAVLEALASGQQSSAGPARLAIVTDTQDFAVRSESARRWLAQGGPRPDGVAYRDRPLPGEVAFVFTNGSATYPSMGTELALAFPAIADAVGYAPPGGSDVLDQIWGAALLSGFHAQISRGLLGLRPDAAIGYSSGESTALGALGAWTDIADLYRDLRASDLFRTGLTGEFRAVREVWRSLGHRGADGEPAVRPARGWVSYVVSAPPGDIRAALAGEATVHLMAINTPDTCVIGGEETACEAVLGRLGAISAFPLDYRIAAHAPELASVLDEYRRLHLRPTQNVPGVRFYSGATGTSYQASADAAADAIAAQAIDTVDFVRMIERAWADGVRVFVEHGPQAQCTGWIRRILAGREHLAVPLDASGGRALRQLCQAVAELVVAGVPVDTSAFFSHLAEAAHDAPDRGETLQLAAHPPPPQLVSRPPATVMPRAPRLPPVLVDSALSEPDPPWTQAPPRVSLEPTGSIADPSRPVTPAPTVADQPAPVVPEPAVANRPAPVVLAGAVPGQLAHITLADVVANQFERVTALHRDYLAQQTEAHAQFLNARQSLLVALTQMAPGAPLPESASPVSPPTAAPALSERVGVPGRQGPRGPAFDRAQLEYLAEGRVSALLGPQFAALDDRRRQTRLPTPPMLLVDRVLGIDAVPASMATGTIWTETDVALDSWYLDGTGRMPPGLMVEAGQADLLLIGWLGVDLLGHGDRAYRLLGCELTYHGSPAAAGDTLRYEIQIDGHAEHAGVRLFSFHYDCYIAGELRMTVRNGQAGFFTDEELARTEGLQWEPGPRTQDGPPPVTPVAALDSHRFDNTALQAFADGRPADCFGAGWKKTRAHVRTPRISKGRMLLFDTVTDVDFRGGPWGHGYLRAETAVRPDDWFFAGHFKNDPCMPGTLMLEGGLQAMAFHLAALGLTIDRDGWRFEPVPGEPCVLRCRGQVSPTSRRIVYEVFVSDITLDPYPTIYADVLGTVDGVKAFHARRAGLRLVPDWPLEHWKQLDASGVTPDERAVWVGGVRQDYAALLACAWGRLTHAMGPDYAGFEAGRRAPRLPGPPYHFMTRVIDVDGPLGGLRVGSTVTAEYDVPPSAWYFEQNRTPTMPFAVIMEVALQPCGWLAMYVGSVLDREVDLLFRNLDGTGTLLREVPAGTQALRTRVELTDISRFGNVIVESFTVRSTVVGGPDHGAAVFEAVTTFGFFPHEAFAQQPGLPPSDAEMAWLARPVERSVDLRDGPATSGAALAGPMLLMLDRITGYWPDAGRAGLGRLRAEKDIEPGEWYFTAHFFEDPVQPGSLGLQAMCHLLQWYLIERDRQAIPVDVRGKERIGLVAGLRQPRFEPVMTGHPVTWKYRGQVVPTDLRVTVELEVTRLGEDGLGRFATADAWLWVDGRRIYQITNLGVRVVPGVIDGAAATSPGARPTTSWTG